MSCTICNDTGWKTIGTRVTRCECQQQKRTNSLLEQARIPRRYEHCEISNFDILPGRYEMAMFKAKKDAEKYVEEFPTNSDHHGLLFVGPIGCGKTHLAVGILKELARRYSTRVLFYDYRELLKEVQNSYNPQVQATEMQVLRPVMDADVLVLDELGAVKPSEWVWDTVSHILNTRYNEQRTTIITTNLADEAPAGAGGDGSESATAARRAAREATLGDRITERMRSRLHEMCCKVEMQGEDFRQRFRSASFR